MFGICFPEIITDGRWLRGMERSIRHRASRQQLSRIPTSYKLLYFTCKVLFSSRITNSVSRLGAGPKPRARNQGSLSARDQSGHYRSKVLGYI